MKVKAVAKGVGIPPLKVRLVADMVREKKVDEALAILDFAPSSSAHVIAKVVRAAVANAEMNFQLAQSPSEMKITRICVDGGPMIKRYRPRARGQVGSILKRSSHITVEVEEIGES